MLKVLCSKRYISLMGVVSDMSVDIEVRYVAPPDFDLFPPHYRPASSLTLSCTATGASDSATFHWRSTNIQSFPYAQRSNSAVSKSILTAYDSGTHTCTVTDGDGSVVSTSIKIILSGRPSTSARCFLILLSYCRCWTVCF